jgi:hypothetical protein
MSRMKDLHYYVKENDMKIEAGKPIRLSMILEYTRVMELQELSEQINRARFSGGPITDEMVIRLAELADTLVDSAYEQMQQYECDHDYQDVYDNDVLQCTFCGELR